MRAENYVTVEFLSRSSNEGFARQAAAAFAAQLDPTLDELGDIKTAVSEAVTNVIVHAYPESLGKVVLKLRILEGGTLEAMRHIVYGDPKRLFSVPADGAALACLAEVCERFLTGQLDRGFQTLDFYKQLKAGM